MLRGKEWIPSIPGTQTQHSAMSEALLMQDVKIIPLIGRLVHKGGVICISEVIDISPGDLDSSLCFFQPSISHDVLCI